MKYPKKILHFINDNLEKSSVDNYLEKYNPDNGKVIAQIASGDRKEVKIAIKTAKKAYPKWSRLNIVKRAGILRKATQIMQGKKEEIARIVALEAGKSMKDALGEVGAAIELGFFISGEGRRFYGRTTTSAVDNRTAYTIRQPIGVAALIVPANTPIANVAWKSYPALLCGNTAVMKASSDTPYTALWFAGILKQAGLPKGVFSVLQGSGSKVGNALINNKDIDLISFTGSVSVGKHIQKVASDRLVKTSLELGGKNPLIVCDDADLEDASDFAWKSAFTNAGQRCASGSRIIVFASVYENFKKMLIKKTKNLNLGVSKSDDLGPVINNKQLENMLRVIENTKKLKGARLLTGGNKLNTKTHKNGYYLTPTIFENVPIDAQISRDEIFGPITCLYKVEGFDEALRLANDSEYGLTAAIHTKNIHRSEKFIQLSQSGVVSVNGATYGSEPHMPFGGLKLSGNGFREPGSEALDFYSEWKTVYIIHDPEKTDE